MPGVTEAQSPTGSMDRVTKARLQLMLHHPFLASAIARLPLVDATNTDWCATAATDGYYIYVNLTFAESLSDVDLGFVLAHELMHCVLGHTDRRGTRGRLKWNIAVDYATNALLAEAGFVPPRQALYDRQYYGMTAETIYSRLPKTRRPDGASLPRKGKSARGGAAPATPDTPDESPATRRHAGGTAGFDIHLDVGDLEGSAERAKDFPSREERKRLRAELAAGVKSHLHGTVAGRSAAELSAGSDRTVPWQELLARFVSGLRRSDYRLFPPNRKHLWRGIYLPSIGVPGPQHLVVVIDTSGSMSAPDLTMILGEIDGLRAGFECRVTVLQCDAAIQDVEVFEPWAEIPVPGTSGPKRRLRGGGGTDFRPAFNWVEEQAGEVTEIPDALIYCTDGYGSYPTEAPEELPVLWVMTHSGARRVPFGDVVFLPEAAAVTV